MAVVSALALAASSCFSYTAETKELHVVNVVQRLDAKNNPQDLRPKNQQSVENQQLRRTLLQVLQLTQSIQVDEISFSSSTSSLANSKLWMRALGLLCTMACGALRPHNAMYNSLLTFGRDDLHEGVGDLQKCPFLLSFCIILLL